MKGCIGFIIKAAITITVLLYVVSPVDFVPGPIDDALGILLWLGIMKWSSDGSDDMYISSDYDSDDD